MHEVFSQLANNQSGNTNTSTEQAKKIVYGCRWMLEPTMPISEVVQTVLLAVKKAREHELREIVARFNDHFNDMSYRVDVSKAPIFNQGSLGRKQKECLDKYDDLKGYLPLKM